jgi:hypothetical protein
MILAVKASQLGELVWVSLVAGLVVSVTFSLGLLGASRGAECRRSNAGNAAAWFALSLVTFAAFLAAVVIAVILITTKS